MKKMFVKKIFGEKNSKKILKIILTIFIIFEKKKIFFSEANKRLRQSRATIFELLDVCA